MAMPDKCGRFPAATSYANTSLSETVPITLSPPNPLPAHHLAPEGTVPDPAPSVLSSASPANPTQPVLELDPQGYQGGGSQGRPP